MNQRRTRPKPPSGILLELFAASNRAGRLLREAMASSPLSPDEFALYSLLQLSPQQTPGAAASVLGWQRSTLSNYLRRMEGRGHLERGRHPADGRSARLQLSQSGHETVHAAEVGFRSAIDAVHSNLDMEPGRLLETLAALNRTLERALRGRDRL